MIKINSKKYSDNEIEALLEMFDASSIISISDSQGNILDVNKNFESTFGIKKEDALGKNYRILNSGEHDKDFFKNLWERILQKKMWKGEVCNRTAFGENLWFEMMIRPILDESGEIEKFITIRYNISELKSQQTENWKQLQFHASINKSTNNIIFKTDLDGVINYVNNAFEQMIGYESEEVLNIETPFLFLDTQDIQKKTEEVNKNFGTDLVAGMDVLNFRTAQGIKNELEFLVKTRNQDELTIQFTISYMFDQDQVPIGYIWVGLDITQRKITEENLLKAKKEAEVTLRLKNQFLSRLSHEIKTPLNAILGMADFLDGTDITTEQKDYLDTIQKSSNRLLSLINKTVEYNKVENENFEINEKRFSINHEIEILERLFVPQCAQKKIEFKVQNKLAHDFYLGDERRIFQIINYYIENAIRFTHVGNVSLSLQEKDDGLLFEIRDTGEGIDAVREKYLFMPFAFESGSMKDDFNGLGLSLAICEKIAKRLGGSVGYKTSEGHGSLFWVKLPLSRVDSLEIPKGFSDFDTITDSTLKVLIVEDDHINQRLLKKMLNKMGVYPEVVSNGLEALEIQAQHKFNVIFMDINMPIMDGFEATKIIRGDVQSYGKPIIVAVTANSVTGDKDLCLNAGMDDYISKPIKRDKLNDLIERILKKEEVSHSKNVSKNKFYIEKLYKDFSGDEEILNEYIQNFINHMPERMTILEMAIKANDFEVIKIESHNLKDLLVNLYQEEMVSQLENLEKYGKDKKIKNILPMFVDLKTDMQKLCSELDALFLKKVV